jgi:serine/threonine-protein kinase HipA
MKMYGLKVTLHDVLVGYVTSTEDGQTNTFYLADSFIEDQNRPTLTLSFSPSANFAKARTIFPLRSRVQLPPLLSNLLPEGALREVTAQRMRVHITNEFALIANMGGGLAGGLVLRPMSEDEFPTFMLEDRTTRFGQTLKVEPEKVTFSLAGVQMKFSMKSRDGRYILGTEGEMGDWIVKTPSSTHSYVPLNEYTAMKLAGSIGVEIPEIRLVEMNQLKQLPEIKLPDEDYAFAIKRFDRNEHGRIHTEDFAQVFGKYPSEKYDGHSYENIGKMLYQFSLKGQKDAAQMAIRLLANILLANGDAHLKNWSLIYYDRINATLSPAYDIVTTSVYMTDETSFALSLNRNKNWYEASMADFMAWADRAGIPKSLILNNLKTTMKKARDIWPKMLADSPMADRHKNALRKHLASLHADFRVEV